MTIALLTLSAIPAIGAQRFISAHVDPAALPIVAFCLIAGLVGLLVG